MAVKNPDYPLNSYLTHTLVEVEILKWRVIEHKSHMVLLAYL